MALNVTIEFRGSPSELRDTIVKEALDRAETLVNYPNDLSLRKVHTLIGQADALRAFAGWMQKMTFPTEEELE